LRSAARRLGILEALIPYWRTDKEYAQLSADERKVLALCIWEALPEHTTPVELTHSRRQLRKFYRTHTRKPADAYEVSNCPQLKTLKLPLDACDRQQVKLSVSAPGQWLLKVLLPTTSAPQKADWAWHSLPIELPAWATVRYGDWMACKPVLQITDRGLVKLLLPLEHTLPPARKLDHPAVGALQARGFALDWGQRRLLTAAIVEGGGGGVDERVLTSGRQYIFRTRSAQTNLYRTREHAEHLAARISRLDDLLAHKEDAALRARQQQLLDEKSRQWAHVSERNKQLACAAALWAVEHALAEDCNVIFLEDLDSLEARKLGRMINGKVNLQVRSQVFTRIEELARSVGIRVIKVPPRGTSNRCSRCGTRSRHYHAPDNPQLAPGRRTHANWLVCVCGHSADRDHSAAERIGARGLQLYADVLAAEAVFAAEAQQTGKRDSKKLRKARERALRVAQDVDTTPKVCVRYRKRSRLSALPYPQHNGSVPIKSSPINQSDRRSRGAGSPRSVSRGVAVGTGSQATAESKQDRATSSTYIEVESFRRVCRLDGMLLGNRGSIRFTRVRARPPEPVVLNSDQELS
jgi:hypothetical protein